MNPKQASNDALPTTIIISLLGDTEKFSATFSHAWLILVELT